MIICGVCRSDQIQLKAWVNANTHEFVEAFDDVETCWCDGCGAITLAHYVSENNDREINNTEGSDNSVVETV